MNVQRPQDLLGCAVYDRTGERIGRVGNVYLDDLSERPEWITVRLGLLGMRESFVPLSGASTGEDRIDVAVSRQSVRDAPPIEAEHGHMSEFQGDILYEHYRMPPPGVAPPDIERRHHPARG